MIRAVICDDERAVIKIIRFFIESEGLPIDIVGAAANGEEALRLITRERPELAFLDINMPAANGFEVIERLNDSPTKIIVVTAFDTFAYAQRALRLGVSDIIAKPIDMEQLRQAVARAIGWNFTSNATLNRALFYIHGHFNEKIELEQLADEACCTTSHISHLFKKYFNMSTVSYVNKVRINRAMQMLQAGESIQETAGAVGYTSLNNFYKYFKIYMGSTPAAYRKKLPS